MRAEADGRVHAIDLSPDGHRRARRERDAVRVEEDRARRKLELEERDRRPLEHHLMRRRGPHHRGEARIVGRERRRPPGEPQHRPCERRSVRRIGEHRRRREGAVGSANELRFRIGLHRRDRLRARDERQHGARDERTDGTTDGLSSGHGVVPQWWCDSRPIRGRRLHLH